MESLSFPRPTTAACGPSALSGERRTSSAYCVVSDPPPSRSHDLLSTLTCLCAHDTHKAPCRASQSRKCQLDACSRQPSYRYRGHFESRPSWCRPNPIRPPPWRSTKSRPQQRRRHHHHRRLPAWHNPPFFSLPFSFRDRSTTYMLHYLPLPHDPGLHPARLAESFPLRGF